MSSANVSPQRYSVGLKSTINPPVRIKPEFRRGLEQALEEGETLISLVEKAVRGEVARRRDHREFIRRGIVAIERTVAAGDGIPADIVIAKLRAKVPEARKKRARSA